MTGSCCTVKISRFNLISRAITSLKWGWQDQNIAYLQRQCSLYGVHVEIVWRPEALREVKLMSPSRAVAAWGKQAEILGEEITDKPPHLSPKDPCHVTLYWLLIAFKIARNFDVKGSLTLPLCQDPCLVSLMSGTALISWIWMLCPLCLTAVPVLPSSWSPSFALGQCLRDLPWLYPWWGSVQASEVCSAFLAFIPLVFACSMSVCREMEISASRRGTALSRSVFSEWVNE